MKILEGMDVERRSTDEEAGLHFSNLPKVLKRLTPDTIVVKRLAPVSKLHETSVANSSNVDRLINKKKNGYMMLSNNVTNWHVFIYINCVCIDNPGLSSMELPR